MNGPAFAASLILAILAGAAVYGLCRLASAIRYEAREARHTPAAIAAAREAGEYCRVLAPRELPAAGYLPPLPPDPPPAETAELPVVTCELGGYDVSGFVAAVFADADRAVMLP